MDKDVLADAKEAFQQASDAEGEQRIAMLDDLKFAKLGEQWDDAAVRQRKLEGRPCLTINRLPAFIKQVTNDARQNRPSIVCHPIGDKADRETAEILNGLIRNIEYTSNADIAYDTALDFSVTCGIGYFVIRTDYADDDSFDLDITIDRVSNPFTVYGDPRSTAADSNDWNTAFITDMLAESAFKARYPDAESSDFEGGKDLKDLMWFQDDTIRIAEYWTRDKVPTTLLKLSDGALMMEDEFLKLKDILTIQGVKVSGTRETNTFRVTQRIITGAEVLETNKWEGKYIPIVPVYGDEINIEGKRSFTSLIRPAKDSQRNFNYWRTAATELVALAPKAPFIGPKGAFNTDASKWASANNTSHAYIEFDGPVAPQRQGFSGPPAGALQEAMNASDDMKSIMGLFDASLGAKSNETSGRAIMARQREGDVSTFNFIDNLSRGIRHGGRILVDLIPKVYNVPRIIRAIKEDGSNYSVPINQPVIEKPGEQPGQPPTFQQLPQGYQDEVNGLTKMFDLASGKYDVTCEAGPSFTSRREEAANQMMEFIRVFPQAAPFVGDLLAKNLDWPGSDDIAKRLQAMLPPQAQNSDKPPQLQQAEAAIQQLQQQMQAMNKELQDKNKELDIKKFDAETKRLAILKPESQTPQTDPNAEIQKAMMLEQQKQEGAEKLKKMDVHGQLLLAKVSAGQAADEAEWESSEDDIGELGEPKANKIDQLREMHGQMLGVVHELAQTIANPKPKIIIRDPNGRAIGVQ